jgi:hypothetical protein
MQIDPAGILDGEWRLLDRLVDLPAGTASIRFSARRTRCSGGAPTNVARKVTIGRKW